MQEKLSLLQDEISSFPPSLHDLMNAAKEFKSLSLDTLNLIEEESSNCQKQMENLEEKLREMETINYDQIYDRRMTLPAPLNRNQSYDPEIVSECGTEDFVDARSSYSPSFYVPGNDRPPSIPDQADLYRRDCLPCKKDPNAKYNI